MLVYASILATAFLVAWLLTPLARRLALRWGIVDRPDVRKQHRDPTPYLGGVAVFGGLLAGLIALLLLSRDPRASFERLDPRMLAVMAGGSVMFAMGLIDDIKHLRARHKLVVQLLVASAMWFAGIRIEGFTISEDVRIEFGVFGFAITVLWIVGVTNAINFIDGLDGLAAGIAAISALAIGFVAFDGGKYPTAAMLAILAGSLLGFLPHNRHPARIFLGDCGSLLIGFLLATSAATTASKSAAFVSVAAPFLALGVPILDMCFAVLRRWIERRGLFSADRNHIHHRLLAIGYDHARTVQILWIESAVLTGLALVLLYSGTTTLQRLLAFGLVLALHVMFFRATGAVRLKESYAAFKAAAARLRENGEHQRHYDELDLHFRTTRNVDEWWRALELAAERVGCASLTLSLPRREGGTLELVWHNPHSHGPTVRSCLPVAHRRSDEPLLLQLELAVSTLEVAGHRLTLLGRLLDRHSLAALPRLPRPLTAVTTTAWQAAASPAQ